tara:strand:+ start:875 stop:1168 length:294 start_codon:yes stop_codon:yes gene_type:complete
MSTWCERRRMPMLTVASPHDSSTEALAHGTASTTASLCARPRFETSISSQPIELKTHAVIMMAARLRSAHGSPKPAATRQTALCSQKLRQPGPRRHG